MFENLFSKWVLWYDKTDSNICDDNWDQFLVKIYSIDSIENFWRLFNNIFSLADTPIGSNYHFFKEGIEPKWEDKKNLGGGKWVLTYPKTNFEIDKIWEKTLLTLISEKFSSIGKDYVNGFVANIRKNEVRFSIWTKNSNDGDTQLQIGKFWKKIIEAELGRKVLLFEYFPHSTYQS
jgi:translation initiation factor 4E